MRRCIVGLALAILLLPTGWSVAAETIKVGAVVPLTGRYGGGGGQVRAGYELAVEAINATGGLSVGSKKLPLELRLLDDESDATKTVARLEALASEGVVAFLGGFGSDLHAAAASVAEKNKIPYCGVAFALHKIHQQGFRYLFSPYWKSPDVKPVTVELIRSIPDAERPKTAAIFQERTDWGREMAAAWTEASKDAGYQVVVNGEYAPGAKDLSDLILKAKAAGADVVFGVPTPPDGMTLVRQMKELGYTPRLLMLIRAPDVAVWAANLGKDGDYVTMTAPWHPALRAPGVRELNEAYQKRFGRPTEPNTGPAYACVQILAAAITRAATLEPSRVRDAIAVTDMATVVGPVKFRPDGTALIQPMVGQWQAGKQELIWPRDLATAPFVYPAPAFGKR